MHNFVKIRVHIPSCANSLALWEIKNILLLNISYVKLTLN